MPSLTFVLPHWLYWGTLVLFPLLAMWLVARQRRRGVPREPLIFNAYLFWLFSGFMGLHRVYLKSWWGFVYIPLFVGILYCNAQVHDTRDAISSATATFEQLERVARRATPAAGATPTEAERTTSAQADTAMHEAQQTQAAAQAVQDRWKMFARALAITIGVLLLIDAALLPAIVRKRRADATAAGYAADPIGPAELDIPPQGTHEDPTVALRTPFTDWIDRINTLVGQYVAYWAVIAVFVYYYEVLARYVFNSPTNWVHESMFLMFGMQYMLCGAYAYREDQHVRVDVVYSRFSVRGKAIADIITSVFFFIFTLTMFWTGWRFAADAVGNGEHSFTEWGIQYWPVKIAIPVGAALIVLQGLSKLIKDILIVTRGGARA